MRRFDKPTPLDQRNIPRSETTAGICLIQDPAFSPDESYVLFVYNTADKNQPAETSPLSPYPNDESRRKYGKPAGGGLAGGGVEDEYLENPDRAIIREVEAEMGLPIARANHLFTEEGVIISDKRTGAKIRRIPYQSGHQVSIAILKRTQKVLDNPIHIFEVKPKDWTGSKLRKLLLEERDYLIESGQATTDEIAATGIYVMGLSEDDYDFLNIEERKEIEGIALISVSALVHMSTSGDCRFAKGFYLYPSHVSRTIKGLEIMGVLKFEEPMGVT